MAYLHCHNCDWQQDDFWEIGGYNPIRSAQDLEVDLFRDKIHLDPVASTIPPDGTDAEGPYVTGQTYVTYTLQRYARNIETMAVRTVEEWQRVRARTWTSTDTMKDLIEALQIFLKYRNEEWPTHCEHDIMCVVGITKDEVSEEDQKRLDELGFNFLEDAAGEPGWGSFKFGKA